MHAQLTAMTLAICALSMALILRSLVVDRKAGVHLIALLTFFAILFVENAAELFRTATPFPPSADNSRLWPSLLPAVGACIWFYAKGLVTPGLSLRRKDWLHGLPVLVIYLCYVPYVQVPEGIRDRIGEGALIAADPWLAGVVLLMLVGWLTWLAILLGYGLATLRLLLNHRALVQQLYSDLEGKSLVWLHSLILLVVCFVVFAIAGSLLPATSFDISASDLSIPAFQLVLVFCVAVFGLNQDVVIPQWNELASPESTSNAKYERSGLTSSDMERIAAKLHRQMADERAWQNPDLSLKDLAAATGIAQNSISQTLNAHIGANFFDYVNQWRVRAACEALLTTEDTVLAIAEDTGFNAKSTFNSAFKKFTGVTPRQFRQQADSDARPVLK